MDRVSNPQVSRWSRIQAKMIIRLPCRWRTRTRWINHFKKIRIIIWLITMKLKLDAHWSAYTVSLDTKAKRLSVLSCWARESNISGSSWKKVRNGRCVEQPISHSGRRSLNSNFGTSYSAKQIKAINRNLLMQMKQFAIKTKRSVTLRNN